MSDQSKPSARKHPLRHLLPLLFALTVMLVVAVAATSTSHAASLGDVDCDSDVDAVDALQILRDVSGLGTSAACIADAADTDCDGDRDAVDALRVLRTVAGLQVSVPPGCGTIGASLDVADVAPDLEFFGELASVHSEPVTATFGPGSDSLPLADGATIEVPAGAFPASTEVTISIINLQFENYLVDPPESRIYVLSTEGDVALISPLALEVPKPADSVNVSQLVDGEWLPAAVAPGATTRIEIDHFSENIIVVTDKLFGLPGLLPEAEEPVGEVPAAFLVACLAGVSVAIAVDELALGPVDQEFIRQLTFSICARALVSRFTPQGENVDVGCVGDKIGPDTDIQEAISVCLAEPTATPAPGVVQVKGSFDESSIESILTPIGFEANEIILSIPKDGGAVTGDFLLVARFEVVDDEGACIFDEVAEGTFVESTLVNGELSGAVTIDASIESVSGCGSQGPPFTFETTWSGSFDGINVANGVVVDIGEFTGSIQP